MLILRTRQIGHRTYNVTCDDRYSSQTDGAYVQIGWTMFTVCESDGDVFIDKSENITVSLSVQMSQNDWLQRLQPKGEATLFHDEITVSKGSLKMEHVYLHRLDDPLGWYLGPVEEPYSELESYHIYQLLKHRSSLLQILALPRGYIVVFKGDHIEAILDDKDVNLLQ